MSLRNGLVVAIVSLTFFSCGGPAGDSGSQEQRPLVMAAFYPLQFAAESVGGPAVEVRSLTPSGVEPHDLELSPSQIRELAEANLVVYLGEGFQPALEDALAGLDAAKQFDALSGKELVRGENEEGEFALDPHIWLDPTMLASIGGQLAEQLSSIAPDRAETFDSNAKRLESELQKLDREFSAGLEQCRSRDIVTSHAAFGYLAARYRLNQVPISGIDPEGDPSPARLAQIARFVEEHHVTTVFFEELAPPDLAETLARETGAKTDVLSPLETAPEEGDYLSEMRANLDRLRAALACE
jgi:zinc transport system substrate-binding protein